MFSQGVESHPACRPRSLLGSDARAQHGPKMARDGPKTAQDGPKMSPTWPQDNPKMAEGGPKTAEDDPNPAKGGPTRHQDSTDTAQDGPTAQGETGASVEPALPLLVYPIYDASAEETFTQGSAGSVCP